MTAPIDFDSLVREIRPQLVRYLARMVGNADAEDVTQATLSRAAAAFSSFRGEASARTWLFQIAANAARDWLRAHRQFEAVDEIDENQQPADSSEDASQDRRLVRQEMSECVDELFARLPERYQTVLALSDCEELSDREIASILGLTEGAAKIRLHRARVRLKQELAADCSLYRDEKNVLCCDRKQG
jgi:RNA polymerase sigma-70 factor, ECF subfamily